MIPHDGLELADECVRSSEDSLQAADREWDEADLR